MPRAHGLGIEGGVFHLTHRCHIKLNMVRCGVVAHPKDWEWVGYHEIMGERQHYRLLDVERLGWRLATEKIEEVGGNLAWVLSQRIAEQQLGREACWTQSLAVGSPSFLAEIQPQILSRRETQIVEEAPELWVLRESPTVYRVETGAKNAPKR